MGRPLVPARAADSGHEAGVAPESGGAARDHRQKPLYDATSKPSDANRCHRFGKRKRGRKSRYIYVASVHEYPRQIPPEKLDEVFGVPPAGENNDPEPYEAPLYEEEPFPDFEAEIEREMDEDEGEHDDTQPPAGRSLAKGVRFEQISEAYRTVAHDNPLTDEKQQETGRTLLGLKQTDMFEAIVSAAPDGNDKVSRLIDAYLTAFQRRIAAEDAGGPSPQAPVPEGFDVRDFA